MACDRCDGLGFTVENREGTDHPYHCSACNAFDPEHDARSDAYDALRRHGRALTVTVVC